ncbi:MAG: FAD-dependent monooxygenase, partial [Chloroflexota bacterium]
DCYFGWSGETITQTDDGVQAIIVEKVGSKQQILQGDYLVGCDGSRSTVREQAGIVQDLSDHDKRMVLLVFRSRELHTALERFPGKSFYCVLHPDLKGYWRFFGRVDVGEQWFFHAPVPMETTRDNFDFRGLLYESAGLEFPCEFAHIGFWDLRFAIAQTYQKGRIFIAGDAAHSHPPYGGYGINTGLEDARNLGWKLAATLQGWGSDTLLTSYSQERQPVFASTAKDFIEPLINNDGDFLARYNPTQDKALFEEAWQERTSGSNADVHSFEPQYEGSPVVFGPENGVSSAQGSHLFTARAGHHLPPQSLSTGQNIFETLGQGFTLLAFDVETTTTSAFKSAADALNMPLKIIRDSYKDGRQQYEAHLILVRPDQFVAWSGDDPASDVQQILSKAVGR